MEQILANLLVADNEVIKKATADLKEAFRNPQAIPSLCEVVLTSPQSQIRQYAAVLLRKRLGKLRNWNLVPPDQQQVIKDRMLQAIVTEQEKSVRNAIVQFVGILVKHEFEKKDSWMSDVLKFIFGQCSSSDPQQSELGANVFSILTDVAPDQFLPHIETLCEMFTAAMVATEASGNMATPVVYHILNGMSNLVPFILGHNAAEVTYQKLIPYIVKALQCFAVSNDPEQFIGAFDILENMADYTPKLLNGSLKILIDFCLESAHNDKYNDIVRVRAVSFIGWLVRLKKKAIIKQKLIEPIIQVVFNLMATAPEDDDEDEDYFIGSDETNAKTAATQTMDLLALHIPSEKLIPLLLTMLDPALKGNDPLHKKAAYLCMAVIAEGCAEAICAKYLRPLLDCVKTGIIDPNPIVRNAALFALGQFSEHLQPDITKFAGEILPILFEYLHQLSVEIANGGTEPKHIDRLFYALETYCENLETELVPHLPILMERLFVILSPTNSVRLRELGLSAVASAAIAAKENMLPYFHKIIAGLQMYLVKSDNEDICALRAQAIDTLASLARTIGKANFLPLANETMTFALSLMDDATEPELRGSVYNLLSALAEILGADMAPVLPKIVERILDTIKSSEEVVAEYKDDVDVFGVDPNDDLAEGEIDIEDSDGEDDDDDIAGYGVENVFLDEKEEAILSLKRIAEHTGSVFLPYLQPSYEAVYKHLEHPHEEIRAAAVEANTQFIITLYDANEMALVKEAIDAYIPKLGLLIKNDEEFQVVLVALQSIGELLKKLKNVAVYSEDLKVVVFTSIQEVLTLKVVCLFDEHAGEATGDEEGEESENDEALIEAAADVLPKFGAALTPEEFALYFNRICPILAQKIEKSREADDSSQQKSYCYGSLSECFRPLQGHTATYFDGLLPLYLYGIQDQNETVRQNAVFGLGELVLFSDNKAYDKFPQILQALSGAVAVEVHPGTLDNICGALARMVMSNYKLIPLEQVLPVFVQKLPLREDFMENHAIFKCFQILFTQGNEALLLVLDKLIGIGLNALYKKEFEDEETRNYIANFLKDVQSKFPEQFMFVANMYPESASVIQSL